MLGRMPPTRSTRLHEDGEREGTAQPSRGMQTEMEISVASRHAESQTDDIGQPMIIGDKIRGHRSAEALADAP